MGNKCYKSYVLKTTLEKIQLQQAADEQKEGESSSRQENIPETQSTTRVTRSQGSSDRSQPCK